MVQGATQSKFIYLLALIFSLLMSAFQPAQADELLEVDQAFQLAEPKIENQQLFIEWKIADDYKLYKDKISVKASDVKLGTPLFSPSETVEDPLFGTSEVFHHRASVEVPYTGGAQTAEITVKYQGCADKLGVCYPPQTRTFNLTLPAVSAEQSQQSNKSLESLEALNNYLVDSSDQPELLEADQAFQFEGQQNKDTIELNWMIADGYHLYKDKIKVKTVQGDVKTGNIQLPAAEEIDDPLFGKTEVYHGSLSASIAIASLSQASQVEIEYQGCSAVSGVCYPPERKIIPLDPAQLSSAATGLATAEVGDNSQLSETDLIADTLKNSSVWIVIFTFLVFGLLLSLTPCVFPMIPILSSIIVGQGENLTTRKAFVMSLVYVLAMSITYTVAGVLAGLFGENLQAAFQNPWIIGTFSAVFILLALSMFGFYELQLPNSVQSKLTNLSNKQQGGTLTGVAVMGFLSALIVGPCVAPPLAGALIYIGQTGDALLGGIALFAMSIGMGAPLLLLGTSAGKFLPRAGAWMDNVKAVFGVMLIGVAIWMAGRIMPSEITMLAWALLLIISAVYLGAFESTAEKSGWIKLVKGLGLSLFVYGVILMIGMLAGSKEILQPLKVFQGSGGTAAQQHNELAFTKIKSAEDLDKILAEGKPVMLDFYADWCVSCKEMEKFTFSAPEVQQALQGVTLVKADVTANDDIDKALMKRFGIIGPPAILFFTNGEEQKAQRVVGFKKAEAFTATIQKAFNH